MYLFGNFHLLSKVVFLEAVVVPLVLNIDKFGRITLPKEVRQRLNSSQVSLEWQKEGLCLRRVPGWDELIGMFPGLDMDAFMKERHEERI